MTIRHENATQAATRLWKAVMGTGTHEQKKQIALTAAKHGLRVEFTGQRMQQAYQFAVQSHRGMERDQASACQPHVDTRLRRPPGFRIGTR